MTPVKIPAIAVPWILLWFSVSAHQPVAARCTLCPGIGAMQDDPAAMLSWTQPDKLGLMAHDQFSIDPT